MSVADYKLLSLSKILKKNNTINTTTFNKTILSARRHWSRHALDFGAYVFARLGLGTPCVRAPCLDRGRIEPGSLC